MAIQPIDLQVLYTQLENVSKNVVAQQQGVQLSNSIQQEERGRQLAKKSTTVQKSPEDGDEVAIIKDHQDTKNAPSSSDDRKEKDDRNSPSEQKPDVEYVSDPELGRHIDISG